jgi:hypothetical protein
VKLHISSAGWILRFKAFNGSTSKKNDSKSMIARRTQLREQLEESGEKVEE